MRPLLEGETSILRPVVYGLGASMIGSSVVQFFFGSLLMALIGTALGVLVITFAAVMSSNWLRRRRWHRLRTVPWSETATRWNR